MLVDLIYKNHINEIDSTDAYFGKILFSGKNILIPYINMGISNHELNEKDYLKHINYSYFVAVDFNFLKINNSEIIVDELKDKYDSIKSIYLGGWDMLENQNIYDLEIQAKDSYIQLVCNYEISENIWIPIKGARFSMNLDETEVENFINNKKLPQNLLNIFKL